MRSRFSVHPLLVALPAVVVALAVACGGSTVTNPTPSPNANASPASVPTPGAGASGSGGTGSGTLRVLIKDSPFSEASAVLVTFSEVSVHRSGADGSDGGWVTLPFATAAAVGPAVTTRTCDLKKLVAATDVLGVGTLEAGHYTQLRLTVDSAKIYTQAETNGEPCGADLVSTMTTPTTKTPPTTEPTEFPVVVPSGTLKLNREFTVPTGGATTITLDFDGDKSIHQTGNGKYMMTPVIGIVSVQ